MDRLRNRKALSESSGLKRHETQKTAPKTSPGFFVSSGVYFDRIVSRNRHHRNTRKHAVARAFTREIESGVHPVLLEPTPNGTGFPDVC